ncbi:DegT/DnrJ/EryC1/StrS family aminotransferase [candidate division WOR-3 bacterium]|nr:DegT/DnrJ/EryC1/StrS family aminotransferase [candidate division WOR-3 bacterium]
MIKLFDVHIPESVKGPLLKTLFSGYIGQGPIVDEFEREFSNKFGFKHVVSLNSGTSAIRLALALIDVGPRDEVISTPYTMVATNTAILEQFAKPIFVDIQYETANLDPADIERHITEKTKAIICVHWGGYPCDMDETRKIAAEHDLPVIEDAAHALGAMYRGKPVGTISEFTAFSFQAIKHLTTGDGGMLSITNPDKYKEAIRRRWFGIDRAARKPSVLGHDPTYDIKEAGYKYHMNDIAAIIGLEQLKYFDLLFKRRAEIANRYREELEDVQGITLLENKPDRTHANWMFGIHVDRRTKFAEMMRSKDIEVSVHNWRNDKYTVFGDLRKDLPNLERLNNDLICIPLHHKLSDPDVDYIIETIKKFKDGEDKL